MNHMGAKKKCRRTPTSRPTSSRSAQTMKQPAKRIPMHEYSVNLLRSSRRYWTLSQSDSSFTGLEKDKKIGAPYACTSHYLRQLMLSVAEKQLLLAETGKQPLQDSTTYKTLEDYHDEVIALKKQIQDLMDENAVLKFKARRTEEEYVMRKKRDAELQNMDPTKVEQTLRQKVANLERFIRDKDVALSKLQNDLKTTKLEEMKVKLDVYLDEIRRLKSCKGNRTKNAARDFSKAVVTEETPGRTKTLTMTLRKMGVEKARLIQENKLLKQDLQRCMEEQKHKLNADDRHEDMTKTELLLTVNNLQQKIEKFESSADRIRVRRSSAADIEGKLPLEGDLTERLDQLDKRETELLEEVSKKTSVIAQLKEDRTYYREKCAENEREVKHLRKKIDDLKVESFGSHGDNESGLHRRPSSVSGRQSPRDSVSSRQSRLPWK